MVKITRQLPKRSNFVDRVYGRLKVVAFDHSVYCGPYDHSLKHKWRCQCEWGGIIVVSTNNLISGGTKSCGCLRRESNVSNAIKRKNKNKGIYYVGKITGSNETGDVSKRS